MKAILKRNRVTGTMVLVAGLMVAWLSPSLAKDKEKVAPIDPNDPTFRLFQKADESFGGKITELYVIADVYRDPANASEESQRILRVDYDKTKVFGKLQIVVRSVGRILPDQMKAYTPKDFFGFGLTDQAKFIKSEAGPFGKPGDIYLQAQPERPLSSVPVTDEVRKTYALLVTEYILPALEKK
jgi:hypothetical protein